MDGAERIGKKYICVNAPDINGFNLCSLPVCPLEAIELTEPLKCFEKKGSLNEFS